MTPAGSTPHLVVVTGPHAAGNVRWIESRLRALREGEPDLRLAVVLVRTSPANLIGSGLADLGAETQSLVMPCQCCPDAAGLPALLEQLAATSAAAIIFVETPALVSAGLLSDLDRTLRWPRELVVCLDAKWTALRDRADLPYFHAQLFAAANVIVPAETSATSAPDLTFD
ncbi:MAG: hypothetical protein HZA93_08875 [Verrucomicrobia bacterium]|nr:hypothetical protein [Verrucomicrobiota bacterium]